MKRNRIRSDRSAGSGKIFELARLVLLGLAVCAPAQQVCGQGDNVELVGRYDTPSGARGVYVSGSLAYLGHGPEGLEIIDVSDPSTPTFVGSSTAFNARDVCTSGGLAYVVEGPTYGGIKIFDVSDPSTPTLRGSYDITDMWLSCGPISVFGDLAYLGCSDIRFQWPGELHIIDVSIPSWPVLRGTFDVRGRFAGSTDRLAVGDICVSGNLAYAASFVYPSGGGSLQIIDVGDPLRPTLHGSYNTSPGARCVCVSGNLAYVGCGNWDSDQPGRLLILDASGPSTPTLRGSCATSGTVAGVFVSGAMAYAAWTSPSNSGLQVIDVSNPVEPQLQGSYDMPGSHFYDLYMSGGLVYFAADDGLWILRYIPDEPPQPPTGVLASDAASTEIVRVIWNASPGADEYRVYRGASPEGTRVALSNWQTSTTWDDTSADVGPYYYYWVRARNAHGESDYSQPDMGWRALPPSLAAHPSWRLYE